MPSNVSFEFEIAKKKYEEAKTPMEKLAALQEMKATQPAHKGAEKLRAEISKKIARLRSEIDKQKKQAKKTSSGGHSLNVKKEGIGQVVLVGPPNSGKSSLLKRLTNVDVEIADYPFTTKKPEVGMMNYKNALVQLVEIPAIVEGASEGKAMGTQLLSIVRNADAILLMITKKEDLNILKKEFENAQIKINEKKPKIIIKNSSFKGITISGKEFLKIPANDLKEFLKSVGFMNATVILQEEVKSLDKIVQVLDQRIVYKNIKVLNFSEIKNFDELKKQIFLLLDKIMIFTRKPGEKINDQEPLVVDKDSTVEDIAKSLHKELFKNLKYVRIWGSSKFPGQRVARDYKLKDGDIVEIYN